MGPLWVMGTSRPPGSATPTARYGCPLAEIHAGMRPVPRWAGRWHPAKNARKFMRFFACVMNMDPYESIGNATLPLGGLVCMQYADTCMQHAPCSRMTRAQFSMQLVHVKHEMHSTWSHEKIPDNIGWRKPPFGMRMRRHVHSCRMTHATSRIHVFFAWEKKSFRK